MIMLLKYIKHRKNEIITYLVIVAVFFMLFFLRGYEIDIYLYGIFISAVILMIIGIRDYVVFEKKIKTIESMKSNEIVYDINYIESTEPLEEAYESLIRELMDENAKEASNYHQTMTALKEYYTRWVHQIKTPIAAMKLLIDTEINESDSGNKDNTIMMDISSNAVDEIKQELFKIECYTESVLEYVRLEDSGSDYNFEYYNCGRIIRGCVKKYATQFIHKKIAVSINNVDFKILTDEKWFSFAIEQIISNAVKYTNEGGQVSISGDITETLWSITITDNGHGIREEDLPRIFEKGFTGYNGRMDKKATGIGMYLCKTALDRLSHNIRIESKCGIGTTVTISSTIS